MITIVLLAWLASPPTGTMPSLQVFLSFASLHQARLGRCGPSTDSLLLGQHCCLLPGERLRLLRLFRLCLFVLWRIPVDEIRERLLEVVLWEALKERVNAIDLELSH